MAWAFLCILKANGTSLVKGAGSGESPPSLKTFRNDTKKLKITNKLENLKNFLKFQKEKKKLPSIFFNDVGTVFDKNKKNDHI